VNARRTAGTLALLAALTCAHLVAFAAEPVEPAAEEETPPAVAGGTPVTTLLALIERGVAQPAPAGARTEDVIDSVRNALESPETQSRVLNTYLNRDHGWQFLRDVNFRFKAFEADSADAALGFSYDYKKSLQGQELACGGEACVRGLDLNLAANGNVAFDADHNPNNLLDTALSFAYFQSTGGVKRAGDAAIRQFRTLQREFIAAETEAEEEAVVRKIESLVRPSLTDQFYWEVAADVSLESNQQFTQKQWTYGAHAVFEVKGWGDDSPFAKFNIFDYPFAALRMLTGYETCPNGGSACFMPRGTAVPTLLVGFARVAPQDDDPRAQAGDTSDFDRVRFEASFRTPLARVGDDRLYVSVNYRYYKELDASANVKSQDLDEFSFYTIVLGGSQGVYVSYSDGRLPLDAASDQVFELGYQFHL
jgi:hypothetical protein